MMQRGLLEVDADDALVAAVRRGDDGAFGELVSPHLEWLTARCRRHLGGDAHAAEDVVQECLVALQRTLLTKDAPMRVRPWLSVVARNRCIDETRKLRAVPTSAIPETAVFDPEVGNEDEYLARAWNALTVRHRAVLELRELGGLSYDEIAANLAVTSGAVEALLFRARSALRREYARAGGKVAAMAPVQEAVARATGGRGVLTGVVEQGSGLITAVPGVADVAAAPLPAPPSGAAARLLQELQVRLLTTPGIDGVLAGPVGGTGRLRSALAAAGLLLGGVAAVAGTVVAGTDLPVPPPVVVSVPDAPIPPAPTVPAPPVAPPAPAPAPAPSPPAEVPSPAAPSTSVPAAPSASTDEVPPADAPVVSVPGLDLDVPATVEGAVGTVDQVVDETVTGIGDLLGGLLSPGR